MASWIPFADYDQPIFVDRAFAAGETLPGVNYRGQPKFSTININVTTTEDGTLDIYQLGPDNARSLFRSEAVVAADVITQLVYTYRVGMILRFVWTGGATGGTVNVSVHAGGVA